VSRTSSARLCVIRISVLGDEFKADVHGALPSSQMVYILTMMLEAAVDRAKTRSPLEGIITPRRMP